MRGQSPRIVPVSFPHQAGNEQAGIKKHLTDNMRQIMSILPLE